MCTEIFTSIKRKKNVKGNTIITNVRFLLSVLFLYFWPIWKKNSSKIYLEVKDFLNINLSEEEKSTQSQCKNLGLQLADPKILRPQNF